MYNTNLLIFNGEIISYPASYSINLRVEPTSPIQAMSFLDSSIL